MRAIGGPAVDIVGSGEADRCRIKVVEAVHGITSINGLVDMVGWGSLSKWSQMFEYGEGMAGEAWHLGVSWCRDIAAGREGVFWTGCDGSLALLALKYDTQRIRLYRAQMNMTVMSINEHRDLPQRFINPCLKVRLTSFDVYRVPEF